MTPDQNNENLPFFFPFVPAEAEGSIDADTVPSPPTMEADADASSVFTVAVMLLSALLLLLLLLLLPPPQFRPYIAPWHRPSK